MTGELKERVSESGLLVVLTGKSASGKDSASKAVREHDKLKHFKLRQVITAASREMRDGEEHGKDYWFHSLDEMKLMEKEGHFVEKLTQTGGPGDWKATQKKEILPFLMQNQSVIWRIDLGRAAEVAQKGYFLNYLDLATASLVEARTIVLRIDPDPSLTYEEIMEIRRLRDGIKFDRKRYEERDRQEETILAKHGHHFKNVIINEWGQLDKTADKIADLLLNFGSTINK